MLRNVRQGLGFGRIPWNDLENWSPTLREEHALRMFEHRVLKRIFGSK
jgi:hypothetical protein